MKSAKLCIPGLIKNSLVIWEEIYNSYNIYIKYILHFKTCWNHYKKGVKVERRKREGMNQFGL
jgi:hypothetical protein